MARHVDRLFSGHSCRLCTENSTNTSSSTALIMTSNHIQTSHTIRMERRNPFRIPRKQKYRTNFNKLLAPKVTRGAGFASREYRESLEWEGGWGRKILKKETSSLNWGFFLGSDGESVREVALVIALEGAFGQNTLSAKENLVSSGGEGCASVLRQGELRGDELNVV